MHYMRKNISPTTVKLRRTQKPCLGEKLLIVKKCHSEWSYHWHWNEVMYNMGTEYSPSQVGIICWGSRQCGTSGTPWSPPSPPPRWFQWCSGDLSPCPGDDFPLQDDANCEKEGEECCDKLGPTVRPSIQPHTACSTEEQKEKMQIQKKVWLRHKLGFHSNSFCLTSTAELEAKQLLPWAGKPAGQIMTMMCTSPMFTCKFFKCNLHKHLDYLPLLHQCWVPVRGQALLQHHCHYHHLQF